MSYFFNPAARLEHLEHIAYYERQRLGLGARYLAAFEAAMSRICQTPQRFKIEFEPDIRLCRIAGFPYNILFRQVVDGIEYPFILRHGNLHLCGEQNYYERTNLESHPLHVGEYFTITSSSESEEQWEATYKITNITILAH